MSEDITRPVDLDGLRRNLSYSLQRGMLGVTELLSDVPTTDPSPAVAYDDAMLVGWQIANSDHELWFDKRSVKTPKFSSGQTAFYDLRRDPSVLINGPYHSFQFYLPFKAINAVAAEHSGKVISDLEYQLGQAVHDPVMSMLGQALHSATDVSRAASSLFLEHILNAVCAHVVFKYGRVTFREGPAKLAPLQERRAKEVMLASFDNTVSLHALAAECGLSVSHFSKAFRNTTGLPPHRWLTVQRVEQAKYLIESAEMGFAEIAAFCGFSDQAHFSRVFSRVTGASPTKYRSSI
ncbi:helix-turn-helix domain-containing protein [Rhizobium sp. HT1-10]|uniref:helix-turn-helix domain-containing protein n=1 Tax=Rhizobium sp. HT1-10 TaxID=3111638 RepID=UPI003C1A7804